MPEQATPLDLSPVDWLSALDGRWSIFVRTCLIRQVKNAPNTQIQNSGDFGEVGTASYERRAGDLIRAEYELTTKLVASDGSPSRWSCRLHFGATRGNVQLADDTSSLCTPGVRSGAELKFASDYHAGCVFWMPFANLAEDGFFQPDRFSLIIRNVQPSCWLIDACFFFRDDRSGDSESPILFRTEWWHCRPGTKPLGDGAEQQLDAVKAERERAREAVESHRSRLEEALSALGDKVQTLEALEAEEQTLRHALDFNELGDALLTQHRALLALEPGVTSPPDDRDPIGNELSALADLEQEADLLEWDLSSLADSVEELAETAAAALWTETQYARGQRLLTRFGDQLPPVDMTFLGSAESAVSNMNADSQALVASALRQHALATLTDAYQGHDYSPVIAAFAKCCERAFADAFDDRVSALLTDPIVVEVLAKPREWEYTGPPEAASLQKSEYCNVMHMLTRKAPGWSGTRNTGIAILLFGGRVELRKGSRQLSPNPLRMDFGDPVIQQLPLALLDLHNARNGFIHHDLATFDDMNSVWGCFQRCLRGLLSGFYTTVGS